MIMAERRHRQCWTRLCIHQGCTGGYFAWDSAVVEGSL